MVGKLTGNFKNMLDTLRKGERRERRFVGGALQNIEEAGDQFEDFTEKPAKEAVGIIIDGRKFRVASPRNEGLSSAGPGAGFAAGGDYTAPLGVIGSAVDRGGRR
jgi:hypothetical protein